MLSPQVRDGGPIPQDHGNCGSGSASGTLLEFCPGSTEDFGYRLIADPPDLCCRRLLYRRVSVLSVDTSGSPFLFFFSVR